MLEIVRQLIGNLESSAVRYCHWKSNGSIAAAEDGRGDLDLLIAREDAAKFLECAGSLGFRLATDGRADSTGSIFHLFGVDRDTTQIVHIHVYCRLITAGSLVKNCYLPLEKMLLSDVRRTPNGLRYASPEADLLAFIARKFIEMRSPVEHLLLYRDRENILSEVRFLFERTDRTSVEKMRETWMPHWNAADFAIAVKAVRQGPGVRALWASWVSSVAPWYRLRNRVAVELERCVVLGRAIIGRRLRISTRKRFLMPGGMVIAFVGSEASGKSTFSRLVAEWYGEVFDVAYMHLGKPPRTAASRLAFGAIRSASKLRKWWRRVSSWSTSSTPQVESEKRPSVHPAIALLDVLDRSAAVRKCIRLANRGYLVITDRYPTDYVGGIDGPVIKPTSRIRTWLSQWELTSYRRLPRPDLVVRPRAPLSITLERNAMRNTPEAEDFVRIRYEQSQALSYGRAATLNIDTTRPFDECVRQIKLAVFTGAVDAAE